MTTEQNCKDMLKSKGLRATTIRLDVLDLFMRENRALSKSDIEDQLKRLDRITLYRTIRSFEDVGLVHQAIDGTQEPKYALCPESCDHDQHSHTHAHFHCNSCGHTYCLEDISIDNFPTKTDFEVESIELVLKGQCTKCK